MVCACVCAAVVFSALRVPCGHLGQTKSSKIVNGFLRIEVFKLKRL